MEPVILNSTCKKYRKKLGYFVYANLKSHTDAVYMSRSEYICIYMHFHDNTTNSPYSAYFPTVLGRVGSGAGMRG